MNLRAKLVYSIGLLGLLCLVPPSSLRASTTYSYTGNAYTSCYGSYLAGGAICASYALDLSFLTSLTGSEVDNLTNDDITATLLGYSATDGYSEFDCYFGPCGPDEGPDLFLATITTDATGDITAWSITTNDTNNGALVTLQVASSSGSGDASNFCCGFESGPCTGQLYQASCNGGGSVAAAGTWSGPIPTPEPRISDFALIGIGFVFMMMVKRKRIAHGIPQST